MLSKIKIETKLTIYKKFKPLISLDLLIILSTNPRNLSICMVAVAYIKVALRLITDLGPQTWTFLVKKAYFKIFLLEKSTKKLHLPACRFFDKNCIFSMKLGLFQALNVMSPKLWQLVSNVFHST